MNRQADGRKGLSPGHPILQWVHQCHHGVVRRRGPIGPGHSCQD
jgi:hypothetical protein